MIPQHFIDDLLYRADIVDVVGSYVQLKNAGANLQGLCPFHKEKSPSFSVSPSKQFYHCFGCGAHGNALGFLMAHLGLTFPEAVESLAGRMGLDVPYEKGQEPAPEERSEREKLTLLMEAANKLYKAELKNAPQAIEYLKNRGLTGQIAARYGLGYAPENYQNLLAIESNYEKADLLDIAGLTKLSESGRRYDRFRNRVMFPIRNGKGEVIGFGGRVIGEGEPKYLNSPETPLFHKGREVYGLFEARQAIHAMGYVLVTEGYMDVVALAQWGFENAVATLGTAVTPEHVQKLFKQTSKLVFAFDGDKAGQKAAWRALEACLSHVTDTKSAYFVFLPPEHDPDSFIREEGADGFEAMVQQALSLSGFLVRQLNAQFQIGSVEGNSASMHYLEPKIKEMQRTRYRHNLLAELAQIWGMSVTQAASLMGLDTRRAGSGQPDVFAQPRRGSSQSADAWGAGGKRGGKDGRSSWRGERSAKYRDKGQAIFQVSRPTSNSPYFSLAVRLVYSPTHLPLCHELIDLLAIDPNPSEEVSSFLHVVEKIRLNPERAMAVLQHAFVGTGHQAWVDHVLEAAQKLDQSLDVETEINDSVYHCCENWFKAELEKLSADPHLSEEKLLWYQSCMAQYKELKQKRVNQL